MRRLLNRTCLNIAAAMSLLLGTTTPLPAEEKGYSCPSAPTPVTSLSYGSRYTDESKTRSDIDEDSNAAVDTALKPVEEFIGDLIRMSNTAMVEADADEAGCVLDWLATWADAGALGELETLNVQLSVPARYAGLAMALLQADTVGGLDPGKRARVVAWLTAGADAMAAFFDEEAPPNASRNNLRAWAGLAAAAVGRLDGDRELLDWARGTFELVLCQAGPDGALPLEMARADKALNYQLHATAPLVVTADLLTATGYDGYAACDGRLLTVATFSLAAIADPAIVEAISGERQTFQTGPQEVEPFMLAWVEPLLRHRPDAGIDAYVDPMRPLSHAKLGGNLTRIGDWIARLPASNS